MSDATVNGLLIGAGITFFIAFGFALGTLRSIYRKLIRIASTLESIQFWLERRGPL